MDAKKYRRTAQWGAVLQTLRTCKSNPLVEQVLELAMDHDGDRALQIVRILSDATGSLSTKDISDRLGLGIENTRQTLRAMREGGFEFEITVSAENWYAPMKLRDRSALQKWCDRL